MKGPMMKLSRASVVYAILGIVCGFLILHPYAMLVYKLTEGRFTGLFLNRGDLFAEILSFEASMLPMGIAFALFGGIIGVLLASFLDKKRRLLASDFENRNREAALDAVHSLMVTLSHYLLNSNMIIGGKVRHCRKDPALSRDVLECLNIIEEQGRKIDAVIGALRDVVEIKKADYSTGGLVTMIDISRDLEARLKEQTENQAQGVPVSEGNRRPS